MLIIRSVSSGRAAPTAALASGLNNVIRSEKGSLKQEARVGDRPQVAPPPPPPGCRSGLQQVHNPITFPL